MLGIIAVYAPLDEDGVYTDIFTSYEEAVPADLGYGLVVGFCVYDWDLGQSPDAAQDFHNTLEEAQAELLRFVGDDRRAVVSGPQGTGALLIQHLYYAARQLRGFPSLGGRV